MLNILTEPLIRFHHSDRSRTEVSLPEVYAALMTDQVEAFPALRPHQRHAWHAFLVQLGAMAMHRADIATPPATAAEWLTLFQDLTPDYPDDEPWQLVVDDITKPAFMQPPALSKEKLKDYKGIVATPDELDMLVTSKNHDLKSSVATQAAVDDWIFALVTLQTMEGFGGAGNFGVSRMNSGFGSRPAFTLAPSAGPGAHFRRDILILLERHPMRPDGVGLLWEAPWDGEKSEALMPNQLDPWYIEVCRRIRLRYDDRDGLTALKASSRAARIESKALNGQTGDPWTPINTKENKSLTLASGGFTYQRVVDYLTPGDWHQPLLLQATPSGVGDREKTQLVARAMVRGSGKTEGYYERIIPLRQRTVRAFGQPGGAQELGDLARDRIGKIRTVQRILSHSIQVFIARGEDDNLSPEGRRLTRPWLGRLDEIVDAHFFEDLQDEFEIDGQNERREKSLEWQRWLVEEARKILHSAEDSLPCPAIHRYRARVRADSLFEGRIRGNRGLPEIFATAGAGE